MHSSLPLRILVVSITLLVLPLFIVAIWEFGLGYQEALKNAKSRLVEVSTEKNIEVSKLETTTSHFLAGTSYLMHMDKLIKDLPSPAVNHQLADLAKITGIRRLGIAIGNENDHKLMVDVANSTPSHVGTYHTGFLAPGRFVHSRFASFLTNEIFPPHEKMLMTLWLVSPADKKTGPVIFFAIVPIESNLKKIMTPLYHPYKVEVALLTKDKIVFAASNTQLERHYFEPLSAEKKAAIDISQQFGNLPLAEHSLKSEPVPEKGFFIFTFNNEQQMAYAEKVPDSETMVIAYTNLKNVFAFAKKQFRTVLLTYVAVFVAGALIVILLTWRMARPFHHLSYVMNSVKSKQLNSRYKKDMFGFEINVLGQIFNETIESLLQQMKNVQDERVKREMLEQEFKIGREVQMQLLPQKMPQIPHISLASAFIPAKEVGGDFYDAFINHEGDLIISIADTSGKGISACLYSLGVRSLLRGFGKKTSSLSEIVIETNNFFYEEAGDSGMFVTLFIASLNLQTGLFRYYSCGHNPPILKRNDGSMQLLSSDGLALGLSKIEKIEEKTLELKKGDLIFLYTDGVTETINTDNELYGMKKLKQFLKKMPAPIQNSLIADLLADLRDFANSAPQYDDITIVVLEMEKN